MKLIIKHYLASLKERDELDAVLPDLLSQLNLNVFSRPGKGTRQYGVDVAAVGSLEGAAEKVYLFSIKPSDLTRKSWDGDAPQSLRSSLNEIIDSYIPTRLPHEHKDKSVVICLCFGGDIQEEVRQEVEGYMRKSTQKNLAFEEWNGDKLASLILSNFLQENLLPQNARSHLRKSIALLDEPETSYQNFSALIRSLANTENAKDAEQVKAIRQINICLWILFAWGRDAGNIESAYLSAEFALLNAWKIAKAYFSKETKMAKAMKLAFNNIHVVYLQICSEYIGKNILPHTNKRHALSAAVQASCHVDVNLKLFDIIGRLSMGGIWAYGMAEGCGEQDSDLYKDLMRGFQSYTLMVKELISNNPVLLLPIKDDQAIDISIAVLLLIKDGNSNNDIKTWLSEIMDRAAFTHLVNGHYPCNLHTYSELLEHPQRNNKGYLQEVTSGSILFPMIALWAALLGEKELYNKVKSIKEKYLGHCNFQFWYPDESSEKHFYTNCDVHGTVLSHVCIDRSVSEFINQAFAECDHLPQYKTLSAVENGFWPLILVACRHYRIPVPLHLMKGRRESVPES